jgi:hypothetical protein
MPGGDSPRGWSSILGRKQKLEEGIKSGEPYKGNDLWPLLGIFEFLPLLCFLDSPDSKSKYSDRPT